MTEDAHWVHLTNCSTGLEADILREALEADDIAVQLKSDQAGIFGAAFQGAVVGGIDVLVLSTNFDRAQTILSSVTGAGFDDEGGVDFAGEDEAED